MAGRIQVGGVRRTAWPWCMADVVRDSRVFIKASKAVLGFRCVSTKYFPIV